MFGISRILLYINTVKYLKGTQIKNQILNRLTGNWKKKKLLHKVENLKAPCVIPVKISIPLLDLKETYLNRFQIEDLLEDKIQILHEKHAIDLTKWEVEDASHLWNYNLHYLEFMIPLAAACQRDKTGRCFPKWCEYMNCWIEHPVKDSFTPYTISMRIPNLLICMNILQEKIGGTKMEKKLINSIYQQYQYLLATQERALLANHYFENIKTILICTVLFGEEKNYKKYYAKFCEQIKEQILSDGLHYERSFMYHKIILEDILRVYMVLKEKTDAERLLPIIVNMTDALASASRGFQRTPLFNDAGDNVAKDTDSLIAAVQAVTGHKTADNREVFDASGYYKLYVGENTLLFDCGKIGPSYMGGHAHCDCLSFELVRDGKLLFVNSGTYQYQGDLRKFFRSTMAHNTLMVDDREQAELWGEHRAARRISDVACEVKGQSVTGRFRSFHGDDFSRKIELTEKGVEITDCVTVKDDKAHFARQFFHLAPEFYYASNDAVEDEFIIDIVPEDVANAEMDRGQRIYVLQNHNRKLAVIHIPVGSKYIIHKEGEICSYAEHFGELKKKEVLEIRTSFLKKAKVQVLIQML